VERIDGRDILLAVEEEKILKGLLARAEDVDDVLRQTAAQEGRNGTELAAQVLQKAAEEAGVDGADVQLQLAVALVDEQREEFQVRAGEVGQAAARGLLEFPESAQAAQERRHLFPLARDARVVFRQRGGVRQEERGVDFALGHHLDDPVVLALGGDVDDGARGRLLRRRRHVRLLPLDHEFVLDQVGEDIPVKSVQSGRVEATIRDVTGRVDPRACKEVQVRGYCHVEFGEELRRLLADVVRVDMQLDSWVHRPNLRLCSLRSLDQKTCQLKFQALQIGLPNKSSIHSGPHGPGI
jgi:hypothetical protein